MNHISRPVSRAFWMLFAATILMPSMGRAADGGLPPIKAVFVFIMENQNWSNITETNAPFLRKTLVPMGAHATQYYTPSDLRPSEPNYVWMEAGSNLGITDDSDPIRNHSDTPDHLTAYLDKAGISWKAYVEDIDGKSCPLVSSGLYAAKHVPFVFFHDVTDGGNPASPYCISHIRPYAELEADLRNNTVARYNFITPNLCNDMHDCGATTGDRWLQTELPKVFASKSYADAGTIFVTWDEGDKDSFGPIGMVVVSPYAKVNYSNSVHYTHSSLLRTMQEIFGVPPHLRDAANAVNLGDLFISAPAAPASINEGGIVNGASYGLVSQSVAPGSIVAAFGRGMTDGGACTAPSCGPSFDASGKLNQRMRTTEALVNGDRVPIYYVSPNQIGLQIPADIAGSVASVQISVGGNTSLSVTVPLAPYAPGIFTFSADGKGTGAIVHQSGAPVTSQLPARRGELLSLYATGFGQVSPPATTGKAPSGVSTAVAPTVVTVGGISFVPEFSGLAGCCVGLNQVNFRLPSGVASGSAVPLSVIVGGAQSNGVTIAVE